MSQTVATQDVSRVISPNDAMYEPEWSEAYFEIGKRSLRAVRLALELAGIEPKRILDLPCGHGRGLRWLTTLGVEIVACDLDRDAVDFCAGEFGATPLYSEPDPDDIPLEGHFDLITSGSLFTHFDAPMWPRFLNLFAEHLSGVLVFSTGGEYFAKDIRFWLAKRQGLGEERADQLLESYERTGFGYAAYPKRPHYGLARAKPSWVLALLDRLHLKVVHFAEAGWDGWQDVYACVKR
jgi:SAM-dependent methyltransferase